MEDQNDTEVEEFVYSDCRIQRADGELDAPALYDDMRVMDMVECIGLGHHPRQALLQSYDMSEQVWTITTAEDCRIVGSFGVVPSPAPNVGIIWMLGTHRMHNIKKTFVKHSREWVGRLFGDYTTLTNLVMTDNELSVRWLTWLGATWRDCSVDGFQQFSLYKQQFESK